MKSGLHKNRQRGFTLIELMVASLMGLFVLGGVLQLFLETKKSYRIQDALSRVQENGRFALDVLSKDIRMAGYIGCTSNQPTFINTLKKPIDFVYDFNTAIEGFEASSATAWTPALTASIATAIPSAKKGSDVITIRRADDQNFSVSTHATSNAPLALNYATIAPLAVPLATRATTANLQEAGFLTADAVNSCATAVVSDCSTAVAFQITSLAVGTKVLSHSNATVAGTCTPKNETDDLGKTYVNGLVYPINTISYYVRLNPGKQFALYRKIGKNDAEELVEGIEQMQILYGVDSNTPFDGVANYYVNASAASSDWSKVISVRISLLVVSMDADLSDKAVAYAYNGSTETGDRRMRRVFTSTIAIRNRLP